MMLDDHVSRRRLLMVLGAGLAGAFGAGIGGFDPDGGGNDGIDLSVDSTSTPTDPGGGPTATPDGSPTPTPTPTPTATGGGDGSDRNGRDDGDDWFDDWADDRHDDPSQDQRDGPSSDGSAGDGPGNDGGGERITATTSPVTVSGVTPGDGGVVDVSLSLSGGPARLSVQADATDFAERGLTDPERAGGDGGPPGELQEHVRVRLRYDGGERALHEGSLASLSDWTPLTGECVPPGTHRLRLEWRLPRDTPDRVQSDAATFSLGFAAEGCAADGG